MPTDDRQVLVTGVANTPATFLIPGNGQIQPKAVFAHYDGSAAGGSFKPALKVISDGGELIGIYPCDTAIAAGASADVSWFPGVKGAATPAPAGAGNPWLFASRGSNPTIASDGLYHNVSFDPASAFVSFGTSDATVMNVVDTGGGIYGIELLEAGLYKAAVCFEAEVTSPPAAGASATSRFTGATYYPVDAPDFQAFTLSPFGTNYFADSSIGSVINVDPGSQPAPVTVVLQVAQSSGATVSIWNASVLVFQVNPTGSPNF